MRINLVDGRIEGYNLKLIGTKVDDKGVIKDRLIINTADNELPL